MTTSLRTRQLLAHFATASARQATMASASASASILALNPQQHTGVFSTPPLNSGVAAKATELLQLNHQQWHMYFNQSGFHSN